MKYRINVPNASSFRSRSVTFKVLLLDNSEFSVKFDKTKVLCSELFEKACERAKISLQYQKYFGLRYINSEDAKPSWLQLEETIKSSLAITTVFQLAIKVFPKSINDAIEDPIFLKHVVYQVKYLFLQGKLRTSIQKHAILDSYFAQAALGDYDTKRHNRGYLETKLGSNFYSVPSSLNSDGAVSAAVYERMVTNMHRGHHGMTSNEALTEYLRLSTSVFGYGAFTYKDAIDLSDKEFILAISQLGIQIFLPDRYGEPDNLVHEYPWGVVASILRDGSRFLFSVWLKSAGKRSNSLQTHSFRFPGHYGHLQAQRIEKDAVNHRNFVIGPQITGQRQTRSKSMDEASQSLERLLPGRQIDRRLVQSLKLQAKLYGTIPV